MEDLDLSDTDRKLLETNYSLLDKIDEEIKEIGKVIEGKAKQDEDAQLLRLFQVSAITCFAD